MLSYGAFGGPQVSLSNPATDSWGLWVDAYCLPGSETSPRVWEVTTGPLLSSRPHALPLSSCPSISGCRQDTFQVSFHKHFRTQRSGDLTLHLSQKHHLVSACTEWALPCKAMAPGPGDILGSNSLPLIMGTFCAMHSKIWINMSTCHPLHPYPGQGKRLSLGSS